MSSKKLVCFLVISLICGLIMGGTAHAITGIGGTVSNADGTPVVGATVEAPGFGSIPVKVTTDENGEYSIPYVSFANIAIQVGDEIAVKVTPTVGDPIDTTHTVTVLDNVAGQATFNITLESDTEPVGKDITSIGGTVSNADGTPVVGATVEAPGFGSVPVKVTTDENGEYSIPYVSFANIAIQVGDEITVKVTDSAGDVVERTHTVAAADSAAGKATLNIALVSVPVTTITVKVEPSSFSADTPSPGTVTATVTIGEAPVTDETVTFRLSPNVGEITAATNNEDGTYTATYTSGGAAGNVTLTATATQAKVSAKITLAINAGPPDAIALSAAPMTVSSLGSATITAKVTDSSGNGVGGLTLTGTATGGGTVTEFTETRTFGTYTASYTAPSVDAEGSDTVTVSTDGVSANLTLTLTPEPPMEVNILILEGMVYKEDGEIPADGVNVTVTVGSNTPQMKTTDTAGAFEVTEVGLIDAAARTGDLVLAVVTDADGVERGRETLTLTNNRLDGTPVPIAVTTDIVIPPRSVNVLNVEGIVYKRDGVINAGVGLDVVVTVGEMTQNATTGSGGAFSVAFVDLLMPVATTGDTVSIVVSDATGQRGPATQFALSNKQLGTTGSATVTKDVLTDIKLTSILFTVEGTVFLLNGDSESIAAGKNLRATDLTVVVTNENRELTASGAVDDIGEYAVVFFETGKDVAESDEQLVIEVHNDAGETVGNRTVMLSDKAIREGAMIDVDTTVPAEVRVLDIGGTVVNLDDSHAGAGVMVTLEILMDGETRDKVELVTDATGSYQYTFVDIFNVEVPLARTNDMLRITVLNSSTGYFGYREMEFRSHQLAYENQPLIVVPPMQLLPPTLRLGGLSIDDSHADNYYGFLSLEAIKKNPELLQLIPSGILHLDLAQNLLAALPPGFNPTPEPSPDITKTFAIDSQNFGNGITPRPAWHVLAAGNMLDSGRWLNGNQLNLYVVTGPASSVDSVTFALSGPTTDQVMPAAVVPATGYMHTFQLEEERAILFLPSWSGLSGNIFAAVTLMIDGHDPVAMTSKLVGDEVVWEAQAELMPSSSVYYYYQVELAQPYQLGDTMVSSWPMPDPRNLQVQNRGIVETLLAPDVPELKEIVTTTDLKLRSVFNVPGPGADESLWVAKFDFPDGADGAYSLDTVVEYKGGLVREIPNQMFTVDRTPPTADITVAMGENAGLYQLDANSPYVTTAHTDAGTLNLTAMPNDASEPDAYLYQIIKLDEAGNPGDQVWHPVVTGGGPPLTYMAPHEIQVPISDVGNYGIRAVGVDSILNISSNTMPMRLNVVPRDPDVAAVTVVHADYNGDGTTDGPFEMVQNVADGVTIFSDRSAVTLTVEVVERTPHPLKSIEIDFQIDGAGEWKPIKHYTKADLDSLGLVKGSELTINWNRMEDFANLLDIAGQAMVRVTVTNLLDIPNEETATLELIPPKLELGGLSINPGYEATLTEALLDLLGPDMTGFATSLLQETATSMMTSDLVSPALALFTSILAMADMPLPSGFETDDEQLHQENFGNALSPRPIWYSLASADQQDAGRWVAGDQLHLYTLAGPTAESVTFNITGPAGATVPAMKVEGSYDYTFQLEEKMLAIFAGIPSAENGQTFAGVTLMIDGQAAPIPMMPNDTGVWTATVALTPGSKVSYHYLIELSEPYYDLTHFPFVTDPRNVQLETRGAGGILEALLTSNIDSLDMNSGLRSTFTVPAVDDSQSLWVGRVPLAADGAYQLDVAVQYSSGSTDQLTGKMFTVDRTPPTAEAMLHLDAPGENVGMYMREDGGYVATAIEPKLASLNFSAVPTGDDDLEVYMYQLAALDADGNPGPWNVVLTPGWVPSDEFRIITDPSDLLPWTYAPPHQRPMTIRNGAGVALLGRYGLRVVGIDNLLNVDSRTGPSLMVDLVPPDPDKSMVSLMQVDFDGDGVSDQPDGGTTVFSDTMATLIVEITERSVNPLTSTEHPLVSIAVQYQVPGGDWETITVLDADMLATAMLGTQLEVSWAVGDYASLPDRGGSVMVRAVTTNALNVIDESMPMGLAYQRRLPPQAIAVYADAIDRHPDSNAPRGDITVGVFTQAMTNPTVNTIQFEVRRAADTEWQSVATVSMAETTIVSDSNLQIPIVEGLIGSIVDGGSATASLEPLNQGMPFYRLWTVVVDTATLEDTISDDSTAGDGNPYVVRASITDMNGATYPSPNGLTDRFSVDNYSPTEIITVANEVEMVMPREDGSYYVSGLIEEDVPSPMLTLTARTGAYPPVFPGGIQLVVTNDSGPVEILETVFMASGDYTYEGVFDLSSIPNGMYTLMAVAYAADGSPEDQIVPMEIAVEVDNFIPPTNFADIVSMIDTEGDTRSSSEMDAIYPKGFPAIDDKITFTLTLSNVMASDIDVLIGEGAESARTLGGLTDDGIMVTPNADGSRTFEVMLDTSVLAEGQVSLVGAVNKPNGSAHFKLPSIHVDRSGPVIEIVSPVSRHQVTGLPTIQLAYTDAAGFDPNDMAMLEAMPVKIALTRLATGETITINLSMIHITTAAESEVLIQTGNIVYTHDEPLVGGAYRIEASVTDVLGNITTAEPVEFTVEGVNPTVSIASPTIGQIVDPRQPLIVSTALTGNGEVEVTEFQINGTDVEGTLEDNWLTYTMEPPLVGAEDSMLQRGSGNTISVKIIDGEGRTAEGAVNFAVSLDSTAPVISGPAPQGEITDMMGQITAQVTDDESEVTSIMFAIDDAELQEFSFTPGMVVEVATAFDFTDAPLGPHSVTIVAESTGGTSSLTWAFTIVDPDTMPPTVVTYSPTGIVWTDMPMVTATVSDESGINMDSLMLVVMDVPGDHSVGEGSSSTSTTVMFMPSEPVAPGTYTARITVEDNSDNVTEAEWQFTVKLDNTPPVISGPTPQGEIIEMSGQITAQVTDDESEVTSIQFAIDDAELQEFSFTPGMVVEVATDFDFTDAPLGPHSVTVVAESAGGASTLTWTFAIVDPDTTPPTVVTYSPTGIVWTDMPMVTATVSDESGINMDSLALVVVDVPGDHSVGEGSSSTSTTVTFTPSEPVAPGTYTAKITVEDNSDNVTEAEWQFTVKLDNTPPVISGPTPQGEITEMSGQITAQVTDEESEVTSIQFAIDDDELQDFSFTSGMAVEVATAFDFTDAPLGPHSVTIVAESAGGASTLTWTFTIVDPDTTPPQVVTYSPTGIVWTDMPMVTATVSDESGINMDSLALVVVDVPGDHSVGEGSSSTSTTVTFMPSEPVAPGTYTAKITVEDNSDNVTEAEWQFTVKLDNTPPTISGPSPQGEITRKVGRITARVTDNESAITRIQFAIDDGELQDLSFTSGMVVEVGKGTEVQGQTNFNFFDAPLGTHSVTIVAESAGGASTLTWTFTIVDPDTTPPTVVTYSPLGIIRTDRPVLAATVSDESGFKRDGITLILAGVPGNQGSGRRSSPTSTTVTFTPSISVTPGPYTARLTVIDKYNNRTEAEWQFTVELDVTPPSITATSPHGVIRSDKPLVTVSVSDDMSGVDTIEIVVKDDSNNLRVNGVAQTRSDKTAATFTPTFSLKDGTYTVDVLATDMSGNKAASKWQFTVELDTIPPSVLTTRPSQEHTENRRPVISASYTDNLSGVDAESVKLSVDGAVVNPDEMSETQVMFTPKYDLPFGQHTVKLEVSDLAPKANTTVHEWSFFVERMGIANARNYPNPFDHETTITFRLSRQASITIQIYDFTGRLVAEPITNSIREAGPVEIEWHGETNAGDHLARGVYFCHILMESELEPQSTILKMAIVSD